MSIPQKGSCRIVVDSTKYRWMIRPRPTYSQVLAQNNMSFAVELEHGARTTLLVCLNSARPDNWMCAEASIVSPSLVERAVRKALALVWYPAAPGSTFQLTMPNEQRLPVRLG